MNAGKFFDFCEAAPFRPLQIFLNDGRNFAVNHPDYLAVNVTEVTIFDEHSNFAETVDISAIVSVRYEVVAV
jgi:hypothetical protein